MAVTFNSEDIAALETAVADLGKYQVISTSNTGGFYWMPKQAQVMYTKTYTDGSTTIEVNVMDDGTIHVEPGAFKLMMERMGFDEQRFAV